MKLNIHNRLIIQGILPKEGGIKTITIVSDIKDKIKITQDEIANYEIRNDENGNIMWNEKGVSETIDVEFTALETQEIKLSLEKLDKENKITAEMLPLCKLFSLI